MRLSSWGFDANGNSRRAAIGASRNSSSDRRPVRLNSFRLIGSERCLQL